MTNDERADPIGDEAHSPLEGIVHRYPDRVLLKAVHVCPVYCRFCFRREMVGPGGEALTPDEMEAALAYIRDHEEVWEVVVTGGDPIENKGDGIFLDHDERYAVTREFLNVYSDLLAGKTVNVEGQHIRIEDGRLLFNPVQSPRPPLYFGGSSDAGIDVAVDTVDKYLTWGEPPAQVAEKIAKVKAVAAQRGRKLSFGIRLHVIVRETNAEAWKAADEPIQYGLRSRPPRR